MRILLLGKYGQLGWELQRTLAPLGQVVSLDYPEVDFTQLTSLRELVLEIQPQVIVNAVGYTAVDKAEEEPRITQLINGTAPGVLADTANKLGSALIHFSTDYVFDGTKDSEYLETDAPKPLGVYAQSKLDGERAIELAGGIFLILRTSWMYSLRRDNFLIKVLSWARTKPILRIVTDQIGNPTSARMLAVVTALTIAMGGRAVLEWLAEYNGIYHVAGDGSASRFEWAEEILRCDPYPEEKVVKELQPALSSEFPTIARRPLYSALNCEKFMETFGLRLPPWQEALQMTLDKHQGTSFKFPLK